MKLLCQIIQLFMFLLSSCMLISFGAGLLFSPQRELPNSMWALMLIFMFFSWMTRPKVDDE